MVVEDLLGAGAGTLLGAVVSWAMTTRTLRPDLAKLAESVKGLRREVDSNAERITALEQLHMGGHYHRRASDARGDIEP